MKPVQVVLDDELIRRIDRRAKRAGVSRSAFIRESLEQMLRSERLDELSSRERAAYHARPLTKDEESAARALRAAQDKVIARLEDEDRW